MRLYSNSQLETFEACPRKYKFRYIDKIRKPEQQSIEAFVGTCVHQVLQELHADLLLQKLHSLEELLELYRALWEREWNPSFKIVRAGLTPQNYFDYGVQCIRNYYARYQPFDQSQTLDLEAHVDYSLDAQGEYQFQGYIDRVARRPDGTYEIHDYKTSRELPSQAQVDSDRQLGLYQIGLHARWPHVERFELVWHYVGLDTTFRSRRTPAQLSTLAQETVATIDRIEQEKEFEPRKSALCDWCEYRPECPLWKHLASVESLPPAQFAADAGVQLANEYAQTKLELDRLAQRLAELRAKIVEFAHQYQATVLAGDGVQVAVTTRETARFPGKHEPARSQLEEFLKKIGKWDEVADLSLHDLEKVLAEGEWPPDLLHELRQFATLQESITVRVSPSGESKGQGD